MKMRFRIRKRIFYFIILYDTKFMDEKRDFRKY